MTPENNIGTNSNTVEAVNPLYEKGQERLDKLKENVSKAKSNISSWFSKGKSFFTEKLGKAALVAASSPEIGRAATDAAAAKVDQFSTAVETKIENAVNAVETKYNEAQQWVGDKKQEAFNWANDKKEQVVQFGKDTVEISGAIAMVAAETASEKYAEVKESVKAKAVEAKEKIQSKWERLLDYGKIAIAAAEAKRQAYIEKRNAERNAKLIAALMQQLQAAEGGVAMAAQQLEASKKIAEDLKAKIEFAKGYNLSAVAA